MPTYEYLCESCGAEWEAEQSMKDSALTKCEKCGKETAKRLISRGGGFILKGGGWYSDLYGSTPKTTPKESGEKAASTESKPAETSSTSTTSTESSTPATTTTPSTTPSSS